MTKLNHRFNREAERQKEDEFLFWWLVALLLLQSTFQPAPQFPQCSIAMPGFRPI